MTASRRSYRGTPRQPALTILQANVGRGGEAHDILLEHAAEHKFDVILVQEPWTALIEGKRTTKSHGHYTTFAPIDSWKEQRPRCLTYIRRLSHLQPTQISLNLSPDMLIVRTKTEPAITLINVYRQPGTNVDLSLRPLLNHSCDPNTIIAGDFNLHSERWEPGVTRSSGVSCFEDWLDDEQLSLSLPYGIATHRAGHTIDLVFSNNPSVTASVLPHAHTTSDHETIRIDIMLSSANPPRPFRPPELTTITSEGLKLALRHVTPPELGTTCIDLDRAVSKATQTIQTLLAQVSPPRPRCIPSKRWWNDDCAAAKRAWHTTRHQTPHDSAAVSDTHREFRRVTRKAKRDFTRAMIKNCSKVSEAHKLVGWHKRSSNFGSPPIHYEGTTYVTPAEKATVFFRTKLARPPPGADLPQDCPTVAPRHIDLLKHVSEEETRLCLLKVKSTSPGCDNLSVTTWKSVWEVPAWRDWIVALYNACLDRGHHPLPFKSADVVVIPKPGKDDLSTPKNWRPISLLPCLGKGLERLVARRLASAAITSELVHSQQFGGLPGRAATDLVECLVHDIESGWARGLVSTLITVDVEGAYDSVQPGRLETRLREQGWPNYIVEWARSFVTQRRARFLLDDYSSNHYDIPFGLPQGSPASPILFLLFLQPLFHQIQGTFGYVDDVAILATGRKLVESTARAQSRAQDVLEFARQNGLTLSIAKTELQHFHRTRQLEPPAALADVELKPNAVTRWLGVYLDTKLTFSTHVQTWAAATRRVCGHVRRLGNTIRGAPILFMRAATLAATLPLLLYGASVWWRGLTHTSRGKVVSSRNKHLVNLVDKSLRQIALAIIPAYRTSPTAALNREAAMLPGLVTLDDLRRKSAIRLNAADAHHPVVARIASNAHTRLTDKARLLPAFPRPILIPPSYQPFSPPQKKRDINPYDLQERIAAIPPLDIVIYSDGSKQKDGTAGAGAIISQGSITIAKLRIPLGKHHEVYDAEIVAALAGLETAVSSPAAKYATSVVILLDNQEAASRLLTHKPSRTSQSSILRFRELAHSWPLRDRSSIARPGSVQVIWIPGHSGIAGNEVADKLANEACLLPAPPTTSSTLAAAMRLARETTSSEMSSWWGREAPQTYRDLAIPFPSPDKPPPELQLPRAHLSFLIQCRTGHGDFSAYHERFHHENAETICVCGRPKSVPHFATCLSARRAAHLFLRKNRLGTLDSLLGTPKGAVILSKFLNASGYLSFKNTQTNGCTAAAPSTNV